MSENIIIVRQLPIIEEQLQTIKADVTARVNDALSLVCTAETVKIVKQARADLNKEFKEWEARRSEVKKAVMSPYEQFEAVYKNCITNVFKEADTELKGKIEETENSLKEQRTVEIAAYFKEYSESRNIDFVTFGDANINITLSASMKSLKEQAKAFIDRVSDDLDLIGTQEHNTEILVEYKRSLNASAAIIAVTERYKAIEAEKERVAERQRLEQISAETEKKVDEIIAPPAEPIIAPPVEAESERVFTLAFKVTATKAKLKELKEFLINGGYKYE